MPGEVGQDRLVQSRVCLTKQVRAGPTPATTIKAGWPCGSGYPQLGNPGAIPLPGSQGDTHTHTRKLEDELNLHLAVGVCYSWLLGSSQSVCTPQGPAPNKEGGKLCPALSTASETQGDTARPKNPTCRSRDMAHVHVLGDGGRRSSYKNIREFSAARQHESFLPCLVPPPDQMVETP